MGHSVSHIIDMRQRKNVVVDQNYVSYQKEVVILQRSTSLEHIGGTTMELAVFDINGSKVMVTRQ